MNKKRKRVREMIDRKKKRRRREKGEVRIEQREESRVMIKYKERNMVEFRVIKEDRIRQERERVE